MKTKLALAALTVLAVTVSLGASEAVWEVIIPTGLQPSTTVLPDPLPVPAYVEYALETAPPAPVAVSAPLRLPVYRPAPRAGKALFDANLVLLVGLNVADYVSTREALKYPGLTETNPLMKPFVKSPAAFAAVKLGTTALSYWSMKVLFKKNRTVAWIMTTASNALLSYVVANNYRLIQGARAR
ncbi:MAG: hypothetical protein KA243_07435 [Candidatus Aminicenantes bacterium]|nr:hypothetical protein [Candidatus Aminicenantes bacterium]NLH77698.1 hypothetical protein [Acidobacteriota bacterium]